MNPSRTEMIALCDEMIAVFEKQFSAPLTRTLDKSNIEWDIHNANVYDRKVTVVKKGAYDEIYSDDELRSSSYEKIVAYHFHILGISIEYRVIFCVIYDGNDKTDPLITQAEGYPVIAQELQTLNGQTLDEDETLFDPDAQFTYDYDRHKKQFNKPMISSTLGDRGF